MDHDDRGRVRTFFDLEVRRSVSFHQLFSPLLFSRTEGKEEGAAEKKHLTGVSLFNPVNLTANSTQAPSGTGTAPALSEVGVRRRSSRAERRDSIRSNAASDDDDEEEEVVVGSRGGRARGGREGLERGSVRRVDESPSGKRGRVTKKQEREQRARTHLQRKSPP